MPSKRWSAFDLWEEFHRQTSIPNVSIQVELQHARQQVWLRIEGALSAAHAADLGQRIRDSLAQSKNRLVLDLNRLHWDKVDDLQPLGAELAAYRSRIRLVLPKVAAAHPEMMLLAGLFQHYRG
jgi:hypothetical protein